MKKIIYACIITGIVSGTITYNTFVLCDQKVAHETLVKIPKNFIELPEKEIADYIDTLETNELSKNQQVLFFSQMLAPYIKNLKELLMLCKLVMNNQYMLCKEFILNIFKRANKNHESV